MTDRYRRPSPQEIALRAALHTREFRHRFGAALGGSERRPSRERWWVPPAAHERAPVALDFAALDRQRDPQATFMRAYCGLPGHKQVVLGCWAFNEGICAVASAPESNVFILGGTRSGKTTLVCALLALHNGPAFVISDKTDIFRSTAFKRSRYGPVGQWDPTGTKGFPGVVQYRWSPLRHDGTITDVDFLLNALLNLGAGSSPENNSSQFWTTAAKTRLRAPVFALPHTDSLDPRFLIDSVRGEAGAVAELKLLLTAQGYHGREMVEDWEAADNLADEQKSSYQVTVDTLLSGLTTTASRSAYRYPNLDLAELAGGRPDAVQLGLAEEGPELALALQGITPRNGYLRGQWMTVYECTPPESRHAVVETVRALLRKLVATRYAIHEQDERAGFTGRAPLLIIIDEFASTCPDRLIGAILQGCADRGVIIVIIAHDLGLAERQLGGEAYSLLTLCPEVLVAPGIRHWPTLRALSGMFGYDMVDFESQSDTRTTGNGKSVTIGVSTGPQHVPKVDPGEIQKGRQGDAKAVRHIDRRADPNSFIWPAALSVAPPWPRAAIVAMERSAGLEYVTPEGRFPLACLPVPELNRADPETGVPYLLRYHHDGPELLARYEAARKRHLEAVERWEKALVEGPVPDADHGGSFAVRLSGTAETPPEDDPFRDVIDYHDGPGDLPPQRTGGVRPPPARWRGPRRSISDEEDRSVP